MDENNSRSDDFQFKAMQQHLERIQFVLENMNEMVGEQQQEIESFREGTAQSNPRARRRYTPQREEELDEEYENGTS